MYRRIGQVLLYIAVLGAFAGGAWGLYQWSHRHDADAAAQSSAASKSKTAADQPVKLTTQAQKNLGLKSEPIQLTTYPKTIDIPGVIVDRPGVSDRGVATPVTGVVTKIFHYPGEIVEPDAPLFNVRLVSESLHASQLELFKATRETEIAQTQLKRLGDAVQSGAIPRSKVIEIENQIERLEVTVQAYQQDLQTRGLPEERIAAVARGEFVTEIRVHAPGEPALEASEASLTASDEPARPPFTFEIHSLDVELGEQVETGEVLCHLADHRTLLIEGRGFKEDMPLIQKAANNNWSVEVEFEVVDAGDWPPLPARLKIEHVANTIDVESRTFAFYLPLENQWQTYQGEGKPRLAWRFRPGDRVHLHVTVDEYQKVFVMPREGVVREGPEAFVFRQSGEFFTRRPVHILYEDRRHVVVANDGSLRPGYVIAQNSAAPLSRVGKAQAASGKTANVHVHADGTVHAAH
jgi:biotin carboxyl carrier protein